jgi:hypothetical protein
MTTDILFLFAPKFCEFGVDVAKAWAALQPAPDDVRVHGLCTGSEKIRHRVARGLGPMAGRLEHLPSLEQDWIASRPAAEALAAFDSRYPSGTMGETITADRRIGRGYVHNGPTRPDTTADAALRAPETVPGAYVVGLYSFLESLLDELAPEAVFCYAVAGAPAYALSRVCALRGISFLQLVPARLGRRYAVDTDHRGLLQATAARYRNDRRTSQSAHAQAQAILEEFRARPQAPDYMDTLAKRRARTHTRARVASLMRKSAQRAVGAWIRRSDEKRQRARREFFEAATILRQRRGEVPAALRTKELPERFIYYPLHVSPEASTMVLAPQHSDQIPVIEALSKALPAGMSLVVKEHVPMIGLRPAGFYERIETMPGVRLVSPFLPGVVLAQKAELVAVITGTAAWEAFLLGRPSISLAEMQFHCVPGAGRLVDGLGALPQTIREARAMPPVGDDDIVRYLAALLETSFDLPAHILWDEYRDADADERARVCADIAAHMQARLDERAATGQLRTVSRS